MANIIKKANRLWLAFKLKNLRPMTDKTIFDVSVGDRVFLFKRNKTVDHIAIACGLGGETKDLAIWKVKEVSEHGVVLTNGSDRAFMMFWSSAYKGFNYFYFKPQFMRDEMHIRAYFKKGLLNG